MFSKRMRGMRTRRIRARVLLGLSALGLGLTLIAASPTAAADCAAPGRSAHDGVAEAWAITVDGHLAAAVESREAAQWVLTEIRERYRLPGAQAVVFGEAVDIEPCRTEPEEVLEEERALALLDPEGNMETRPLTVLTLTAEEVYRAVPYGTETVWAEDRYADESELIRAGSDGLNRESCSVLYMNGREAARTLRHTETVTEPVTELIARGTIPGSRSGETGTYIWPTTGVITSDFGGRESTVGSKNHKGVDIGNSSGTQVLASDGGTVVTAKESRSYGKYILIEHRDGAVTCYAHLREILVSEGQHVAQGQLIGEMGSTGIATGPHLHFEIRPDGATPQDPMGLMTGELQRG